MEEELTFQQWESTDRTQMSTIVATLEEFVDLLCDKMDALSKHSFIAKSQGAHLKKSKEELPPDTAIIICDFAENYQYVIQGEVQSYHWSKEYCTLHPISIYIKQGDSLNKAVSLCVLSDDIKHDTPFVYECMKLTVQHCREHYPHITKFEYFTDGCAGQYKNYKNFLNLCLHAEDFGVQAVWNFFATCHGKGPCDGIGGTVKRLVRLESLRRVKGDYITDIDKMFAFCHSTIKNVKFYLLKANEMKARREETNARFGIGSTIPGTQSFHQFIPISKNTVGFKRISSDKLLAGEHTFGKKQPPIAPGVSVGSYVATVYDLDWYIGLVDSIDHQRQECMINFMHPKLPTGFIHWPATVDKCLTPLNRILTAIDVPSSTSLAGRPYQLKKTNIF